MQATRLIKRNPSTFSFYAQTTRLSSFTNTFKLLEDMPKDQQDKQPMFTVSKQFGFLPRKHPIRDLPPKYEVINKILKAATIN
jgi:indoleamine 2,3-dioxygenase